MGGGKKKYLHHKSLLHDSNRMSADVRRGSAPDSRFYYLKGFVKKIVFLNGNGKCLCRD